MPRSTAGKDGKFATMSDAIRDMIRQHPKAKSKEIVELLAKEGITVQPSLVYFIRSKRRHKKRRQKQQRVAEATQRTGTANPVQLIVKVKNLAQEAGGLKHLKQLVDLLAE
jgi:hypothetical protein